MVRLDGFGVLAAEERGKRGVVCWVGWRYLFRWVRWGAPRPSASISGESTLFHSRRGLAADRREVMRIFAPACAFLPMWTYQEVAILSV